MTRQENGSIIVWILIAVALFAALSFAMIRDGDSSIHAMSDAQARISATEIIEYSDKLEKAIQILRSRGVSENQIDFKNDVWQRCNGDRDYAVGNTNSNSDSQRLFHADGGKLQATFFSPPTAVPAGNVCTACPLCLKEGHMQASSISVSGVGTSLPELALLVSGVPEPVCKQINKILGVNDGTTIPVDTSAGAWTWKGTFGGTGVHGDEAPELIGRTGYCVRNSINATRQEYWRVLLVR